MLLFSNQAACSIGTQKHKTIKMSWIPLRELHQEAKRQGFAIPTLFSTSLAPPPYGCSGNARPRKAELIIEKNR